MPPPRWDRVPPATLCRAVLIAQSDIALEGWVQREPLDGTEDDDLDAICLYTTDPVD